MKNKKNILIKLLIVLTILVTFTSKTLAYKRAVFPDVKSLQPIPTQNDIHPNVSGNINNTVSVPPDVENTNNAENSPSNTQTNETQSNIINNSMFYTLTSIIIILLVVCLVLFIYQKTKEKKLN